MRTALAAIRMTKFSRLSVARARSVVVAASRLWILAMSVAARSRLRTRVVRSPRRLVQQGRCRGSIPPAGKLPCRLQPAVRSGSRIQDDVRQLPSSIVPVADFREFACGQRPLHVTVREVDHVVECRSCEGELAEFRERPRRIALRDKATDTVARPRRDVVKHRQRWFSQAQVGELSGGVDLRLFRAVTPVSNSPQYCQRLFSFAEVGKVSCRHDSSPRGDVPCMGDAQQSRSGVDQTATGAQGLCSVGPVTTRTVRACW